MFFFLISKHTICSLFSITFYPSVENAYIERDLDKLIKSLSMYSEVYDVLKWFSIGYD